MHVLLSPLRQLGEDQLSLAIARSQSLSQLTPSGLVPRGVGESGGLQAVKAARADEEYMAELHRNYLELVDEEHR